MSHPTLIDWTDFVEGELSAERMADLRNHRSGCRACRRLESLARELAPPVATDAAEWLPNDVLWAASAILGTPAERRRTPALPRLETELLHAASETVASGFRSGGEAALEHRIYRSGSLVADLRTELDPDSGIVSLIGQFADRLHPEHGLADLPACLRAAERIFDRSRTNSAGELSMRYPGSSVPELRVGIPGHGLFSVTLKPLGTTAGKKDMR